MDVGGASRVVPSTHRTFSFPRLPLIAAALLISSPVAAANPVAEALCDEGYKLLEENRDAEACVKLEQGLALAFNTRCQINLAVCHENIGRVATATSEYKEALEIARKEKNQDREALAKERIVLLESRVPHIVVLAPPNAAQDGIRITLDGNAVPPAAWGTPIAADPGVHRVLASGPGTEWFEKSIQVAEAEQRTVKVSLLAKLGSIVWPLWLTPADRSQSWVLKDSADNLLCNLPCLKGLPRESGYRVEGTVLIAGRKETLSTRLPERLAIWPGELVIGTVEARLWHRRAAPITIGAILGGIGTALFSSGVFFGGDAGWMATGGVFDALGLMTTMTFLAVPPAQAVLVFEKRALPPPVAGTGALQIALPGWSLVW